MLRSCRHKRTKTNNEIPHGKVFKYARDFFVECIKNNNPKSSVGTLAERQAARNKVSNAVIIGKAVAKDTEAMDKRPDSLSKESTLGPPNAP